MGKRWTAREIDRLKSLWDKGLTTKVIASKMKDRSVASVRVKLHSMQKIGFISKRNNNTERNKNKKSDNKESDKHEDWRQVYTKPDPYNPNVYRKWPWHTQQQRPIKQEKSKEWDSQKSIVEMLREIELFLLTKNDQYGDSALAPIRIFSKSDKSEQLKVRIDDKLNRLMQGNASIEKDEDVIKDLIGYLVLLLINIRDTQ